MKKEKPKYQPAWYASPINLPERTLGKFSIRHRIVEKKTPVVGARQAYTRSTRPVMADLKEPLRVHELVEEGHGLWMTDLPEELNQIAEMLYHVQPRGAVCAGGLGLGLVAQALTQRSGIRTITVVEKSPEVIKLCAAPGYRVVCDDILHFLQSYGEPYDYYLLDTWGGTSEMTWWNVVLSLRRAIRSRWGRKPIIHCWAEDIMWGQVERRLIQLTPAQAHWYYAPEFCNMTREKAKHFLHDAGLPYWEKQYGTILDQLIKAMREKRKEFA